MFLSHSFNGGEKTTFLGITVANISLSFFLILLIHSFYSRSLTGPPSTTTPVNTGSGVTAIRLRNHSQYMIQSTSESCFCLRMFLRRLVDSCKNSGKQPGSPFPPTPLQKKKMHVIYTVYISIQARDLPVK